MYVTDGRRAVAAWTCLFGLAVGTGHADGPVPQVGPLEQVPLDLRLPELRRFIGREELDTPLPEQLDDVMIWAHPETSDMMKTRPVPGGLGGIFWGLWHPTQFWRLFVPDPNLRMPPEGGKP